MIVKDYYRVLAVEPAAPPSEIYKAYRNRAFQLHPDRNPHPNAHEQFVELNEAFEVIKNPIRRARYDRLLKELAGTSSSEPSSRRSARAAEAVRRAATRGAARERKSEDLDPLDIGEIVLFFLRFVDAVFSLLRLFH